jgi:hypothetical protein
MDSGSVTICIQCQQANFVKSTVALITLNVTGEVQSQPWIHNMHNKLLSTQK